MGNCDATPTEPQLASVAKLWGLTEPIRFLRRMENFVFESATSQGSVIVRFTDPTHRSIGELEAELAWMEYLAGCGMSVAVPVRSVQRQFVAIVDEPTFHVSVLTKVGGSAPETPEDYTPKLLRAWGKFLGDMHQHTKSYVPDESIPRRSQWHEDAGFKVTLDGLDASDAMPFKRFHELFAWAQQLDRTRDSYGLVHCDLHHGNFFVEDGRINAFDFDDAVYHWFAYDIAIPLYYVQRMADDGKLAYPYLELQDSFLNGYAEANLLEQIWYERIPLFMKFRTATVYHWKKATVAHWDLSNDDRRSLEDFLAWSRDALRAEIEFE